VTWSSEAEKSKFALISKQQSEQKYEKEDLPKKERYNNCNESYNNVIKRDTKWVIQKLPDLVTQLYELEQDQTRDVRGALFDKGKYVLSKQAAVLKVSLDKNYEKG
jgi:hypothetical protein